MVKADLTSDVMDRVVRFEKRRSVVWIGRSATMVVCVLTVIGLFGSVLIAMMSETKTWELVSLVGEDKRLVGRFWQDTLATFWEEVPKGEFAIVVVSFGVLLMVVGRTVLKMPLVKRRMKGVAEYLKEVSEK